MSARLFVAVLLASAAACGPAGAPPGDGGPPDSGSLDAGFDAGTSLPRGPAVVLMIGDGMGAGQLEAASHFAHGRAGALRMQQLPYRGLVVTSSLSGLTDSAAAATALASGVLTRNGLVGVDRSGAPLKSLVERAHELGLRAGVVTTSSLPHATPGAFTAHRGSRDDYTLIAEDQALAVRPDVMLGGGAQFFLPAGPGSVRQDTGLLSALESAGYRVVRTRAELGLAAGSRRVAGLFAPEHLDYVVDRPAQTAQPDLTEMSLAALELLDQDGAGFFLMIEGARIDMASHLNDLQRTVGETLAFDEAVGAVEAWAQARGNVLLLVTADHECGGLTVTAPEPAGTLPQVSWRWDQHTNARVSVFGVGPGAGRLNDRLEHRSLHALMEAHLSSSAPLEPTAQLLPDGYVGGVRHRVSSQLNATSFGVGINQLDSLWLDADAHGLHVGVEGLFEWNKNALVLLLDADFGAASGPAQLDGALSDRSGRADSILSSLKLGAPPVSGFGADFAVVAFGGQESRWEDLLDGVGLRGLSNPADLAWLPMVGNFGDDTRRSGTAPGAAVSGAGFEAFLPWTSLYPALAGRVPAGATVAVSVVLVNDDGGYTSNQALPSFPAGTTASPGGTAVPLPGVASFKVDADGDGVADGATAPSQLP